MDIDNNTNILKNSILGFEFEFYSKLSDKEVSKELSKLLKREIRVKFNATRPNSRMIGHTGYITFGRKLDPFVPERPEKKTPSDERFPMPEDF